MRVVERLLSSKSLRRMFVASCMRDHPERGRFNAFSGLAIEWRWETLGRTLDHLVPLFDLLKSNYDISKLSESEEGKSEAVLLREVDVILKTPHFVENCELVRVLCGVLQRFAHRLEGCECHASLWKSQGNALRKKRVLKSTSGHEHCFFKTRQAVWLQTGGFASVCDELLRCTSDLLQTRLDAVDHGERSKAVRDMNRIAESIVEELKDKLGFHTQLPYNIIRCFVGEMDPSRVGEARRYVAECTSEYDNLILQGKGPTLHRVAHRLLDPGSGCRQ